MTTHLPGDPGSISAAAATARRSAATLRREREVLRAAYAHRGDRSGGRAALRSRQIVDALSDNLADLVDEIDRLGAALQAYAVGLADSQAAARAAAEDATRAGLAVSGGRVDRPWGVRGLAVAGSERDLEASRQSIQRALDDLALARERDRSGLEALLLSSTAALATTANDLRLL